MGSLLVHFEKAGYGGEIREEFCAGHQAARVGAERLGGKVRIPPQETPEIPFPLTTGPAGNPVGMVLKK